LASHALEKAPPGRGELLASLGLCCTHRGGSRNIKASRPLRCVAGARVPEQRRLGGGGGGGGAGRGSDTARPRSKQERRSCLGPTEHPAPGAHRIRGLQMPMLVSAQRQSTLPKQVCMCCIAASVEQPRHCSDNTSLAAESEMAKAALLYMHSRTVAAPPSHFPSAPVGPPGLECTVTRLSALAVRNCRPTPGVPRGLLGLDGVSIEPVQAPQDTPTCAFIWIGDITQQSHGPSSSHLQ